MGKWETNQDDKGVGTIGGKAVIPKLQPVQIKQLMACLETEEESSKKQEDPRPKITTGPRDMCKTCEELMKNRYIDCKGIKAQGFLCSGSLSRGIQLKLSLLLYQSIIALLFSLELDV